MLNYQYLFAAFILSASFSVTIWSMLNGEGTARSDSVTIRTNHGIKSRTPVEFVLQSTPDFSTLVDHDGDKTLTSTDKQLEALLAKRTGVYVDPKPEWTQPTVLVTASNWNYRRMLFNWQCHAARHGLDYIVISMDPKIHKFLGDGRSTLIKGKYVEAAAGNFRSPDFNTITCNKLLAVHDILMTGRDVVFSDPDNVLVKDPFKDTGFGSLGEMIKSNMYDLIYSLNYAGGVEKAAVERRLLEDGQVPFYSIRNRRTMGNTGFYWMRSTPGNIALLNETIYQCIEKRNLDDQTLLWEVVLREIYNRNYGAPHYFGARHCTKAEWEAKKSQVSVPDGERAPMRFCNLDLDKYVTGRNVTWPGLVTYHSNFATGYEQKLHKLIASTSEVGSLWVLGSDDTCSGWGRSNMPPDARSSGKLHGRGAPELALASASDLKAKGYTGMDADPLQMLNHIKASCSKRGKGRYLTFSVGDAEKIAYGASNQLVALVNMGHRAMRENRTLVWPERQGQPHSMKHGGGRYLDYLRVRFDLNEFFSTFCVVDSIPIFENPDELEVLKYQPLAAFYDHVSYFDKTGFNTYIGLAMRLIFGNPRAEISSVMQRVKQHLGARYIGVHLRNLDPLKSKFLGKVRAKGEYALEQLHQQYTMSPEYVDGWRKKLKLDNAAIYLGSDDQRPELTKDLKDKLGAIQLNISDFQELRENSDAIKFANAVQLRDLDHAVVDFMIMMNSSLFLGNDASTVSWSVIRQRRIRGVFADNLQGPM